MTTTTNLEKTTNTPTSTGELPRHLEEKGYRLNDGGEIARRRGFLYDTFSEPIYYPESDGKPLADSTTQYELIVALKGNLDILLMDREDAFVAADLLWYPLESNKRIRVAPDVLVVFGQPKGKRGSYIQWKENGVSPQVVVEIISPSNTWRELAVTKNDFYNRHGVQEYYVFDPDEEANTLDVWVRSETTGVLEPQAYVSTWTSPLLGIRFDMLQNPFAAYYPDGGRFMSMTELEQKARQAEEAARKAEERATRLEAREARLLAKLRELGVDPNGLDADNEEGGVAQ